MTSHLLSLHNRDRTVNFYVFVFVIVALVVDLDYVVNIAVVEIVAEVDFCGTCFRTPATSCSL
eukprot:m.96423 g.96423  ORF g.96423 m.96423 type:complete len:63 (+) comp12464_c0_seq2:533-721(+)